ncbi:MAG: sulfotransferase [Desulfobacteraceae bacterium]|nr:sulfotransferase [Desulfobacteraceae bacterium]
MGIELSSDYFINQAIEKTGLEDFGSQTYKEGLDVLINSLNNDIELSEGTAGYFQNQIMQLLINRIEVTQLFKDYPEISDEIIDEPIFIVGLPRSGTTILQTLLALDPTSRYLRNFETAGPFCPPAELIPESVDQRIQLCHEGMESFFSMAPVLRGINGINFMAHGTAECQNLMAHEFVHMGWSSGSSLFSHGNWVGECNMKSAYQWHRRLLQILQWKLPNERWVLKAPMHLFGLDLLKETYPDAKVVFTHRPPFDAMVSGVSMVYHWTQFTTGQANIQAIAEWYPKLWSKGLERALSAKKHIDTNQCLDIFHTDLSEDPIKTIEHIYNHFDIPFLKGAKKRMKTWLRDHPRSKFGGHNYTPEKYSLNADQEKERFSFYNEQFDL